MYVFDSSSSLFTSVIEENSYLHILRVSQILNNNIRYCLLTCSVLHACWKVALNLTHLQYWYFTDNSVMVKWTASLSATILTFTPVWKKQSHESVTQNFQSVIFGTHHLSWLDQSTNVKNTLLKLAVHAYVSRLIFDFITENTFVGEFDVIIWLVLLKLRINQF